MIHDAPSGTSTAESQEAGVRQFNALDDNSNKAYKKLEQMLYEIAPDFV